jgi:hypothetical protein
MTILDVGDFVVSASPLGHGLCDSAPEAVIVQVMHGGVTGIGDTDATPARNGHFPVHISRGPRNRA